MGGDLLSGEVDDPLFEQPYLPHLSFQPWHTNDDDATLRDVPIEKVEDATAEGENGIVLGSNDDDLVQKTSPNTQSSDYETSRRNQATRRRNQEIRRRNHVYRKVLNRYDETQRQNEHLEKAKTNVMSYRPGLWIEYFNGMKLTDYKIPNTTTLLLVGTKGSGKSSLVNRIFRVLDDDKFSCDRAQVSYNYSAGAGTHFLLEYMIPRGITSFCLYDTRSLSENLSENMQMLKNWMTKGVRHGELVVRGSDSISLQNEMKYKACHSGYRYSETRTVNFVIFVVNGLSILRSMEGEAKAKIDMEIIANTFSYPFLSFRDDKPVVAMTHGDLLSLSDRVKVRLHLGELLGVSPMTQIFDIPENHDQVTELEVLGMLHYSLEHADRNLPGKEFISRKVWKVLVSTSLFVLFALLLIISAASTHFSSSDSHHSQKHSVPPVSTPMDWRLAPKHWTRRLWLGEEYD